MYSIRLVCSVTQALQRMKIKNFSIVESYKIQNGLYIGKKALSYTVVDNKDASFLKSYFNKRTRIRNFGPTLLFSFKESI